MIFHATAVLTITMLCSIVIFLMMLFLYHTKSISSIVLNTVLMSLLIISIRWLFPTEFIFATTIPIKAGFPRIMGFLWNPVITLFSYQVSPLLLFEIVWAIGAFFLAVRAITTYSRLKNAILLCSTPIHIDIESNSGRALKNRIIVSSTVDEPIIIGYFKPMIVLPVMELTQEELRIIVKHEMTHYKKKDLWIHLVITILRTIYWWNPFCYFIGDLVSDLLELRVDRFLLSTMTKEESVLYLEIMLKVAKNKKTKFSLAFGKSIRFKNFSNFYNLDRKISPMFQLLVIMVAVIITVLPFTVVFEPYSLPSDNPSKLLKINSENAFLIDDYSEYELFVDEEYFITLSEIPDSLLNLGIYD